LLLPAVWGDSAAEGRVCKSEDGEGQEVCVGAPGSDEGEVSSLLQRKPTKGSGAGKMACPIPSTAMDTLQDSVNSILDTLFSDVLLEHPTVSRKVKVFKCRVKCTLDAYLNVTGLSSLQLSTFDCDGGTCLEERNGICTKWRASVLTGFTASELAVEGFGDANTTFNGSCYFLKALPDIPHFKTTARIVKPDLVMQLSADFSMDPPSISNTNFAPVSFTYEKLDDFECGIHWFPTINRICNDYIGEIVDQFKETILGLANDGIHNQEGALQDGLARAAAKTKA